MRDSLETSPDELRRMEQDADKMRARNCPEADTLIRKQYRDGFGI